MTDKKFILVTGGAGYIGSHTVVELHRNGFVPVIVDDFRNSSRKVLKGIENLIGVKPIIFDVDVCDKEALNEVFKQYYFEGVIHFAANKAVGESVSNPLKYYRNNVIGLVNCLELMQMHSVNCFLFSSSCTVYGQPENDIMVSENSPFIKANSPYGATKQIGERIIEDVYLSTKKSRFLNLRYFNPIGSHSSCEIGEFPIGTPDNLIPFVTQTAIGKRDSLTVFGNDYNTPDGTCIRDYIHVVDLANAHVKGLVWLLQQTDGAHESVNIGTGKGTSVKEIIDIFEKESGLSLNWRYGERRPGDVEQIFANNQKANLLLNWKPELSINQAISDAWNWEKKLKSEE
jgi:UDP-glucose 4-epimerase